MKTIHEVMTRTPFVVEKRVSIDEALRVMHAHQIRHLPVVEAGRLVGLLVARDVEFTASINGAGHATVSRVMISHPYSVEAATPLSEVVTQMSRQRLDYAVIVRSGEVLGVFTGTDALRILGDLLHRFEAVTEAPAVTIPEPETTPQTMPRQPGPPIEIPKREPGPEIAPSQEPRPEYPQRETSPEINPPKYPDISPPKSPEITPPESPSPSELERHKKAG